MGLILTKKRKIEDFTVGTKIIFPVGIIVNELLTNSMKYAFIGRNRGNLHIARRRHLIPVGRRRLFENFTG